MTVVRRMSDASQPLHASLWGRGWTVRLLALVVAFGPAVGVLITTAGPAATRSNAQAATTTPPWEPEATGEEVGGVGIYNASGAAITTGSITAPFGAYLVGAAANPLHTGGDNLATLYLCSPQAGVDPGSWNCEEISGPTSYPDAGAPAPIGTTALPVVATTAQDETMKQVIDGGICPLPLRLPDTRTHIN